MEIPDFFSTVPDKGQEAFNRVIFERSTSLRCMVLPSCASGPCSWRIAWGIAVHRQADAVRLLRQEASNDCVSRALERRFEGAWASSWRSSASHSAFFDNVVEHRDAGADCRFADCCRSNGTLQNGCAVAG